GATSRRRTLQLMASAVLAAFVALPGGAVAEADKCVRAGHHCHKGVDRCCSGVCGAGVCCADGEICQDGHCVTPPPLAGPDKMICICGDGTQFTPCATLDCDSSAAQDAICGPLCAAHGGETATGCISNDPLCVPA